MMQVEDTYEVPGSTLRAMVTCALQAEKALEKSICATVEATDSCIKQRDMIHSLRLQLESYLGEQ